MPEEPMTTIYTPIPNPSRLVDAFIKVADDVTWDVIKKAQMTNTPVITSDADGNILAVDADVMAERFKKSRNRSLPS
ncbi:MAG: hypothetical protein K2X66_14825 [Cyanobacteria bacterium]|nr:hypothetical protein [Cyanobacteriota bacterium]